MRGAAFAAIAALGLYAHGAGAQSADDPARPVVPGLAVRLDDVGDGRAWSVTTRVDEPTVMVTAATSSGSLAVSFRRERHGNATCATLLAQLLHSDQFEHDRVATPAVFRGVPWDGAAYQQNNGSYDAEFACLRVGTDTWLASAIAQPRAGVSLADAAPVARSLARALSGSEARRDYPLWLETSAMEIDDPHDATAWLLLGRTAGFPIASDALSSTLGEARNVSLTVAVRNGTCAAAWTALRPALATEGTLVDRPGYVPDAFGARVRRIPAGDHLREVYCVGTTRGALLVTAVFRADDGDAMTRLGPMLRALVAAAQHAPAPAASPAPR